MLPRAGHGAAEIEKPQIPKLRVSSQKSIERAAPVEVSADVVSVTRGLGVVWPHKGRRREKRARGHDHTHHESSHRLGALLWSFLPLEAASPKGLTTGGVLTQLLEEWSQRVQFHAKAGPVTGFQLLHSAVVVAQRLPRPIGLGAGERGFGWRLRRGG